MNNTSSRDQESDTNIETITQEQMTRLFSMTWDANDKATTTFSGNDSVDSSKLNDYSWLQAVQLKTSVFFKDDGLQWKTSRDEFLVNLPVTRNECRERIKVIDHYHFAFKDGEYWLVFRARDWEEDHYTPPK